MRAQSNSSRSVFIPVLYALLTVMLGAAMIALWIKLSHPSSWMIAALLPIMTIGFLRPCLWLVILLALLPVIDRTPITGNGYVTESDALLGGLMIVLALRMLLHFQPRLRTWLDGSEVAAPESAFMYLRWRVGPLLAIFLLALSYVIALWRGLMPIPALDANATVLFGSNMEALRIARGPLLALWCLPLLNRTNRGISGFAPGAIFALLGIGMAVLSERLSFTDLTDFTSDYRTTGPFWEMHVGGAALDGALLLTLPFALWFSLRGKGAMKAIAALTSLLGIYAVLVGFTRSTYLAVMLELVALGLCALRRKNPQQPGMQSNSFPMMIFFAAAIVGMMWAFPTSGYRGMLALLGFIACAWVAGGSEGLAKPWSINVLGLAVAASLCVLGIAAEHISNKAIYMESATATGLFFIALWYDKGIISKAVVQLIAMTALAWCGITAVRLANHWGGANARMPMLIAILMLSALVLASQRRKRTLWQATGRNSVPLAIAIACAAMIVAVFSNYYIGQRFATVAVDMKDRESHWRDSFSLIQTTEEALLGLGAGQFPIAFHWSAANSELPGDFHIFTENGTRFLALGGPRHLLGFGEIFRVSQRLKNDPLILPAGGRLKARAKRPTTLHLEICRKHLIYANDCTITELGVPGDDRWHDLDWKFPKAPLLAGPWYANRPLVFSIGAAGQAIRIDATDIQLTDAGGWPQLDNGDFARGVWRWFPSSDRDHLPWHAKNMFLHLLIENGALGLLAVLIALSGSIVRLATGFAARHPLAPPLLASLVGFTVAGMFDSVVDAPRVGFMFFLWLGIALGVGTSSKHRASGHTGSATKSQ